MAVKENKALRAVRRIGTLALVAGFLGSAISVAAAQQDSDVTGKQGEQPQASSGFSTETSKRVTVVRGQPTFTAQNLSQAAELPDPRLEVLLGYDGWYIDHENGEIVNCFRVNTFTVGVRRIKCISKRL
jgi:hypothetical protein